MTDISVSNETDNIKHGGRTAPQKVNMVNRTGTLDRLIGLMKQSNVEADPSDFDHDPDLDDQAELERMNLIMDFIDDLKNEK